MISYRNIRRLFYNLVGNELVFRKSSDYIAYLAGYNRIL